MTENKLFETVLPYFGKTQHMIGMYLKDQLKKAKITISREKLLVLIKLRIENGLSQNEIAHRTERNKTTIARLLDTMEKSGLIERIQNEKDKRVKQVYLTSKGNKLADRCMPIMYESAVQMQKGLDPEQLDQLRAISMVIQSNINNTKS